LPEVFGEIDGQSTVDLAPDDFLFQHIKIKMRGKRFSSPEKAVEAFKTQSKIYIAALEKNVKMGKKKGLIL